MLFTHCECPEEGTRNVVSECLGKLTLIDPKNLLNNLKQHLDHPSALTRSTVVTAIKFTISDQVSPAFLPKLKPTVPLSVVLMLLNHTIISPNAKSISFGIGV